MGSRAEAAGQKQAEVGVEMPAPYVCGECGSMIQKKQDDDEDGFLLYLSTSCRYPSLSMPVIKKTPQSFETGSLPPKHVFIVASYGFMLVLYCCLFIGRRQILDFSHDADQCSPVHYWDVYFQCSSHDLFSYSPLTKVKTCLPYEGKSEKPAVDKKRRLTK